MYETITLDRDSRGIVTLWLDRAEKHNALSALMIAEITDACGKLNTDAAARVVILGARGKSFCAGGDLDWMRAQMQATPLQRGREAEKLARMLQSLNTLAKPLIGRVHGNAFGGGVGMAAVCDVAIGADTVMMGLTEVRLGLIPATIGPYICARMGEAHARQVFLSGRRFDAAEAQRLGLLAQVVAHEDLDDAVATEAAHYLDAAPDAVARAKALLRRFGPPIGEAEIAHSIEQLVECWQGSEAPEGIGAFFERRKPAWQT